MEDMGGFIALGILIGFIYLVFAYWYVTLSLVAIGIGVYLIAKAVAMQNKRRHAERQRLEAEEKRLQDELESRRQAESYHLAEEEARRERHIREQLGYRSRMTALGEQSLALFESTPKLLGFAEKYLDQAEADFAEGAFAPYWDSIEHAANALARFIEDVHRIQNASTSYTELIGKYEETPPQFPLARESVTKLGVGTATAERMKRIVRVSQRNFQFSTIYEQRKTNQMLVAGFTNLAQALERMTTQVKSSIENLSESIEAQTTELKESMYAIQSRMDDMATSADEHHDEQMAEALERGTREKAVLELLDNIHSGRRPS